MTQRPASHSMTRHRPVQYTASIAARTSAQPGSVNDTATGTPIGGSPITCSHAWFTATSTWSGPSWSVNRRTWSMWRCPQQVAPFSRTGGRRPVPGLRMMRHPRATSCVADNRELTA